ncbi:MAG: amidase [Minicystis sp.]
MSPTDPLLASALEQARLIRERALGAEELTRIYLARIARHNDALQAFVEINGRRALAAARRKDEEVMRGDARDLPPFHGVPLGIKDLNLARGTFTRFGSRAFKYVWTPFDDKTTAQLRRGGFVILGKLATSEIGAMPVTEPSIHPPTRNPWSLDHSAGGSSGGSGAAVAAGLLPIAQGSDGAGSIRIPSAFCHLFGLKPSRGRVADPYGRPDAHTLATSGPIARTVDDAAAMLDVMAGLSVGTPHWAARPPRAFAKLARETPPRLRIKVLTRSPLVTPHPEITEATLRVGRLLAELGHTVEEGPEPVGSLEEFLPIWQKMIADIPVPRWSLTQPITRWLAQAGKPLRAEDIESRRAELEHRILTWFGDADLWITPTVALPAPRIGAFTSADPAADFHKAAELGAFTALFNISGQPAASVPAGLTSDGLPIGVQLAGKLLAEGTVLSVAKQLEIAMPWSERRADIASR